MEAAAATLTPEQWQFQRQGPAPATAGRPTSWCAVQGGRAHHPAGQRRLHLPQPPRLPGRRRVRPAPGRHGARRPPPRAQARRVLAAAAATRRRGGRRRARDVGHPSVGPSRLGRGRRRVPLVVHRGPRGLRGDPPRLRGARATSSIAMVGKKIYKRLVQYLEARRRPDGAAGGGRARCRRPTASRHGAPRDGAPPSSRAGAPCRVRLRTPPSGASRPPTRGRPTRAARASDPPVSRPAGRPRRLTGPGPGCLRTRVSAMHHEACSSSGSAPHSGQRLLAVATERFRLRASSKRRCRPFFTSDSSVGRARGSRRGLSRESTRRRRTAPDPGPRRAWIRAVHSRR